MDADDFLEARLRKIAEMRGVVERRSAVGESLEVRDSATGSGVMVSGYACVTDHPYEIGDPKRGGFTETIKRGAFKRTLSESPDVILNALHGRGLSGLPLARTKSGSLTLTEDARGLQFTAELDPSDPDVQTLLPKLRRGDLDGASFAFRVTDEDWSKDRSTRTIRGIALQHGDVSIVDHAANPAASAHIQSPVTPVRQLVGPSVEQRAREQEVLNNRRVQEFERLHRPVVRPIEYYQNYVRALRLESLRRAKEKAS